MHEDKMSQREMSVIFAMGAYDNLGRHLVMENRGELTKSQVDVLMGLKLFGKMSMTQISEHLAVSKEQASRAVGPLVEQGLVRRERSSEHYRIIEISLTDEGNRKVEDAQLSLYNRLVERLEPLSEEERELLVDSSCRALEVLVKLQRGVTESVGEAEKAADERPAEGSEEV